MPWSPISLKDPTLLQQLDTARQKNKKTRKTMMKLKTKDKRTQYKCLDNHQLKTKTWTLGLETLWHTDSTALWLLWEFSKGTVSYFWHCAKQERKQKTLPAQNSKLASIMSLKVSISKCWLPAEKNFFLWKELEIKEWKWKTRNGWIPPTHSSLQ